MPDDIAIKVENLTKDYKLYQTPLDRLKEAIHPFRKKYHHKFHALNNITCEIKKGETVGIIGKNGSGKSTLLKLITGVISPTSGKITVTGQVSALLELGAGFNPELTGLENVYFNGLILGFTRLEMDRKLDDILNFADIGEYVHQPVKTFSSGMFVRLAFAVAISVDPDILIIDEALAVGDVAFQLKCMKKLENFKSKGVTVLFVSHDTNVIKKFCNKSMWINNGKIIITGKTNEVVDQYNDYLKANTLSDIDNVKHSAVNNYYAKIINVSLLRTDLACADSYATNDDVIVQIEYDVSIFLPDLVVGVAVLDIAGTYICGLNTKLDRFNPPNVIGRNSIMLKLANIKLLGGSYFIDVGLFENTTIVALDYLARVLEFTISDESNTEGFVMLEHQWLHEAI